MTFFRWTLGLVQAWLMLQVLKRFLRTAGGKRLQIAAAPAQTELPRLSVIVPVLNEYERLAPCLEGLLQQGNEVAEILVVDGGSRDGTQSLVDTFSQRDARLRLLDASPVPADWNGKSWGLHTGLQHLDPTSDWVLTLDADVYPDPLLVRSLLMHALKTGLGAFSVATLQEITDIRQGLLHPALLTTLVYRFGIPGQATRNIQEVQANGQCFLVQRRLLEECGGFASTGASICEDVTLARALVMAGHAVGFYEAGDLLSVAMYRSWREAWENWPRSLPMHDHFSGWQTLVGWLEIALVQALPLPLFLILLRERRRPGGLLLWLNGLGLALRLGVLYGTARAYRHRPWSYWLSPLCDLPVVFKLGKSALQRQHTWRGRTIVRGGAR
jgi:dolichol-phosphate mannosyltransferase